MTLLRISELLEDYTRKRAKQSLSEELALNIDTVWLVKDDGETLATPLAQIKTGDKILVQTGNVIPLDGEIVNGEAIINESAMTGEPLGVLRRTGAGVYAGTVVEEGNIEINVRSLANDTRIQKIISLIDKSETLKANAQSKAEKLADAIVPFSFLAAAATFVFTGNFIRATSVLMVDYSCAIKLATPICIISTMHKAAKRKILIKGGKHLEAFANADVIVFDKTGTLTAACPSVKKIIPFGDICRDGVLRISACLEEHFPHSMAKAITRLAEKEGLQHREEHAKPQYVVAHGISSIYGGKRVLIGSRHFIEEDEKIKISDEENAIIQAESDGFSTVFLAVAGKLAGMICINDPVRKEAKAVLDELKNMGIKRVIMLTGDSKTAAKSVCEELGIDEFYASVLPDKKAEIISRLQEEGRSVIMVGDGINDSPALAQADVSVAVKDGSDIAKEVADISLLSQNLGGLITLRKMSCEMLKNIDRNYFGIIGINSALLLAGAWGIILPSTCALLHNVSTMLLCASSMREKTEKNI